MLELHLRLSLWLKGQSLHAPSNGISLPVPAGCPPGPLSSLTPCSLGDEEAKSYIIRLHSYRSFLHYDIASGPH